MEQNLTITSADLTGIKGVMFDTKLPSGVAIETVAFFDHDYEGMHYLLQVFDHRADNPHWRYLFVANTRETPWTHLELVRDYGSFDENRSSPLISVAAQVAYWRKYDTYPKSLNNEATLINAEEEAAYRLLAEITTTETDRGEQWRAWT